MERVVVERRSPVPLTLKEIIDNSCTKSSCFERYRVRHIRTSCSPDGRRFICEYEAPDAESPKAEPALNNTAPSLPNATRPEAGGSTPNFLALAAKGKYRVEFSVPSATKTRTPNPDIPGEWLEEASEMLPPRYHRDSTMTLDYDPADPRPVEYKLAR